MPRSEGDSEVSVIVSDNSNAELHEPSTSRCVLPRKAKENPGLAVETNPYAWTEDEKLKLALALEKHGHLDIEKLHEEVPTKTPCQIKIFTDELLRRGRINLHSHQPSNRGIIPKSSLEDWLCLLEKSQVNPRDDFSECLAKSLFYISRYEPHPDPKDCGGVDFAAMYEFLYNLVKGYPLKAVNPETAAALLEALDGLSGRKQLGGDWEKAREHLRKVRRLVFLNNATKRHYGRKDTDSEPSEPIKSLLDVRCCNPLGVPYDLLKRPENQSLNENLSVKE